MIVERQTWNVKRGCRQELVAFCKSFAESAGLTTRIYTDNVAPHGTLVLENEFESLAEMESFWKEWFARAVTPADIEKWFALTERGGYTEIWDLE